MYQSELHLSDLEVSDNLVLSFDVQTSDGRVPADLIDVAPQNV